MSKHNIALWYISIYLTFPGLVVMIVWWLGL